MKDKSQKFIDELNYVNENFLYLGDSMTDEEKVESYLNDASKGLRAMEEFTDCNSLRATVITNGYKGGDSGHGSRTYLKIEDTSNTDITAIVNEGVIEIVLGGDSELDTISEALKWMGETLMKLANEQR